MFTGLLQLRHDHSLELVHPEHAHEDVDAIPHLVDAVGLDSHVIGPEVPAHLGEVLLVVLRRNNRRCCSSVARGGV